MHLIPEILQLSQSRSLEESAELLSPVELKRALALQDPLLRQKWASIRASLRLELGLRLGLLPRQVEILYSSNSKPYVPGALHFNLSHSGELALLALSDCEVGIDVEKMRPRPYLALGRRFFAPAEMDHLNTLGPEQLPLEFYRMWTSKEAIYKCLGGDFLELCRSEWTQASCAQKGLSLGSEVRGEYFLTWICSP